MRATVTAKEAVRRTVLSAAVIVFLSVFAVTLGRVSFQPKLVNFDFVAFYCGGSVVAAGGNPYLMEPLRTCEHAVGPVFHHGTKLAVPAPLPAYDFAVFSALSHLPFNAAAMVWFVLQVVAFGTTIILLASMCRFPPWIIACALVVSDFYSSSLLGQVASFSILGIVLAGWAIENDNGFLCTIGLVLAMIEPHLGVSVVTAIFFWGGRFKVAVVMTVLVLGAISVRMMPAPWINDYFVRVLAAHALSESNNQEQFGSLYAAHVLGVPEQAALLIAKLNYVAALVVGVALARPAARLFGTGMFAFAPVTFVLLGGPFLHVTQVAAALPAALLVSARSQSRAARAAVALLSIPWLNFVTNVTVLPLAASVLCALLRRMCKLESYQAIFITAFAIVAEICGAFLVAVSPQSGAPTFGPVGSASLPEITWKALIDAQQHGHVVLSFLAKLPSLLGVLAIAGVIAVQSLRGVRVDVGSARPSGDRLAISSSH